MTSSPVLPNADHVLVASPSAVVRQRVLDGLIPKARRVEQASGGAEALGHLENGIWQLLVLDRRLPDLDAEEVRQTVNARYPEVEVVLLDDESQAKRGPDSTPEAGVAQSLADAGFPGAGGGQSQRDDASGQNRPSGRDESCQPSHCVTALPGMVGDSLAMQTVYRLVKLVSRRDTTVLITGPTGSGKELVARALHDLSPRASRTFAVVNCAAIPETLLEAELFGYSRGAFTGAQQSYAGRIQAAHQGTLFLDEIGEMPLSLQPKLLRFLEQKELQRLGSSQVVRVDARVVAATNRDLVTLVRQGNFREDLYYRLAAFPLSIPPLAQRPGDVAQLASYFLQQFCPQPPMPELSEEALTFLKTYSWPGNVRELQNVMERALILAEDEVVVRTAHLTFFEGCLGSARKGDRTPSSGLAMRAF